MGPPMLQRNMGFVRMELRLLRPLWGDAVVSLPAEKQRTGLVVGGRICVDKIVAVAR